MPVGVRYTLFGPIAVSVGAGIVGVTAAEAAEDGLLPAEFVAYTVQVYGSPLVSPVTMIGLEEPDAVPELEPLLELEQVAV